MGIQNITNNYFIDKVSSETKEKVHAEYALTDYAVYQNFHLNDSLFDGFDLDGDGVVSDGELQLLASKDGNAETFSLNDFRSALKYVKDDKGNSGVPIVLPGSEEDAQKQVMSLIDFKKTLDKNKDGRINSEDFSILDKRYTGFTPNTADYMAEFVEKFQFTDFSDPKTGSIPEVEAKTLDDRSRRSAERNFFKYIKKQIRIRTYNDSFKTFDTYNDVRKSLGSGELSKKEIEFLGGSDGKMSASEFKEIISGYSTYNIKTRKFEKYELNFKGNHAPDGLMTADEVHKAMDINGDGKVTSSDLTLNALSGNVTNTPRNHGVKIALNKGNLNSLALNSLLKRFNFAPDSSDPWYNPNSATNGYAGSKTNSSPITNNNLSSNINKVVSSSQGNISYNPEPQISNGNILSLLSGLLSSNNNHNAKPQNINTRNYNSLNNNFSNNNFLNVFQNMFMNIFMNMFNMFSF